MMRQEPRDAEEEEPYQVEEAVPLAAAGQAELGPQPASPSRRGRSAAVAASVAALVGLAAAILLGSAGAGKQRAHFAGLLGLDEEKPAPQKQKSLPFPVKTCNSTGCTEEMLRLTIDANWRWFHDDEFKTCGDCSTEDCSKCSHQQNVDYAETYGVTVAEGAVTLTKSARLYLLDASGEEYFLLRLLGKEFSFDVDVSALRCGVNSALYTVEMDKDGGYPTGASIGTGYCDAQCPRGMKTIGGKPDTNNTPQCCFEMDLWEANRRTAAFTAHPCQLPDGGDVLGNYVCEGAACNSGSAEGEGVCDGIGCDVNPYRNGLTEFYNRHDAEVSSAKPITVTTQFHAAGGKLLEVKRKYIQDGEVVEIPLTKWGSMSINTSLTDEYCQAESQNFSHAPATSFISKHGGIQSQGKSLARGNVLAISLWSDDSSHMLWLDGTMNEAKSAGDVRGPCGTEDNSNGLEGASVTFSNFRFGDIGTTFAAAFGRGPSAACVLSAVVASILLAHMQT